MSNENRLDAFIEAKELWESVIVGQTEVYSGVGAFIKNNLAQGEDWATDTPQDIDDIYIAGFEEPIDGAGNILGSASPKFLNGQTKLPINGVMRFDSVDVGIFLRTDPSYWTNTIVHEMAHVLGYGTVWSQKGLLRTVNNRGSLSFDYLGLEAQREWEALGCTTSLPIESDFGPGTAGGHWDERCLTNELMTGLLNQGDGINILSRITIASFEDLGYRVNYDAAGAYDSSNVGAGCCNLEQRNLAPQAVEETLAPSKAPLSADLLETAAEEAAKQLQSARVNAPIEVPEGLEYVAGDMIKIFVIDDDGKIQDATFHWDDVKHRVR